MKNLCPGCLRPYPQECYVKVMGANIPVRDIQTNEEEQITQQFADLRAMVLKNQKKAVQQNDEFQQFVIQQIR